MHSIDLQDTAFSGTSRSFTLMAGARRHAECRHCGSSLAGRLEDQAVRTVGGTRMAVDTFRCRCGHGRQVRRELSGAAAA